MVTSELPVIDTVPRFLALRNSKLKYELFFSISTGIEKKSHDCDAYTATGGTCSVPDKQPAPIDTGKKK
jgi:hypothetical protein